MLNYLVSHFALNTATTTASATITTTTRLATKTFLKAPQLFLVMPNKCKGPRSFHHRINMTDTRVNQLLKFTFLSLQDQVSEYELEKKNAHTITSCPLEAKISS